MRGRLRGDPPHKLSPREREVVGLLAEGLSEKEVATRLDIATSTVNTHLQHLMQKLGLHDRFHVVEWAVREGLAKCAHEKDT